MSKCCQVTASLQLLVLGCLASIATADKLRSFGQNEQAMEAAPGAAFIQSGVAAKQFPSLKQNEQAMEACFGANWKAGGASISHCFMEHDTHNTCCMMDKKTRDENDAKGNPIGRASLDVARAIAGKSEAEMPDADDLLTPWCTCFGSQVCSFYAKSTNTKIKFVNDCGCAKGGTPGKGFCMANISSNHIYGCEGWAREQFQMPGHSTPGVKQPPSGQTHCSELQGTQEVDVSSCA